MEIKCEKDLNTSAPGKLRQIFATGWSITLGVFSLGTSISWTSPAIPDIESKNVFGNLGVEEKSWIASLVTLGALAWGPITAFTVDRLGRRGSIMMLTVPMTVGWICITSGYSIYVMYLGRFLTGLAVGGNTHVIPVYVGEIAHKKIRGALMSIMTAAIALGLLYTNTIGTFVSWQVLSATNVAFPVILLVLMFVMPETPTHLLNKGKNKEAEESLLWFRGDDKNEAKFELDLLKESIEAAKKLEGSNLISEILNKNSMKALGITLALMAIQQLSGINAVHFFLVPIFKAAGTNIDEHLSAIIIGIVILTAVFVNSVLVDRAGRRVLLMLSCIGMGLSISSLATFFLLKKQNGDVTPEGLSIMPIISLIVFVIAYDTGAGPVPWLMMSELLPPRIKGFGCGLTSSFSWAMAFLVTKTFEGLFDLIEIHGCFYLFGGICFLGLIFVYFCVPETKNQNFDEIQKKHFNMA